MEERSNILCDSPLYDFISAEWPNCEDLLGTATTVEEDHILLFLLWTLDSIKSSAPGDAFLEDPWTKVRHVLRKRLISDVMSAKTEILDYLTNVVCAYALYCWGLVMAGNSARQDSYMTFVHQLGEHWKPVQEIKNAIQYTDTKSLKEWLSDYIDDEAKYYTIFNSVDWDEDWQAEAPEITANPYQCYQAAQQPIAPSAEISKASGRKSNRIALSAQVDKVDFVRVVNALCEHGFFVKEGTSTKAAKTHVIEAFGNLINDPGFKDSFFNHLHSASNVNNDSKANIKIFDELKTTSDNFFKKK